MRRRSGFTLVEMLIVLAIIAALIGTVTPIAVNAVRSANATKVASEMEGIKSAAITYVLTERPSTSGTTFTLNSLSSYYDSLPTGYTLTSAYSSSNNLWTVTITYTGSVDKATINNINPLISSTAGTLVFRVEAL